MPPRRKSRTSHHDEVKQQMEIDLDSVQEQEHITSLNDRLAYLVNEIQQQESGDLSITRTVQTQLEKVVQSLHEETSALRKMVDDLANEKSELEVTVQRAGEDVFARDQEIRELGEKLAAAAKEKEALDAEYEDALAKLDNATIQGDTSKRTADVNALKVRSLEEELERYREELSGVQAQLKASERDNAKLAKGAQETDKALDAAEEERDAQKEQIASLKKEIDSLRLENVGQKNKIQSLNEDLELYKKENRDLQLSITTLSEKLTIKFSKSPRNFNDELVRALSDLREKYEIEAEIYRQELRKQYKPLTDELTTDRRRLEVEVDRLKSLLDSSEQDAEHEKERRISLSNSMANMEERLSAAHKRHRGEIEDKDEEIAQLSKNLADLRSQLGGKRSGGSGDAKLQRELESVRSQYKAAMEECKRYARECSTLLEKNTSLARELQTYEKWLGEGELKLFGRVSPGRTVKRQREENVAEVKVQRFKESRVTEDTTLLNCQTLIFEGNVNIDEVNAAGAFVKLNNKNEENVDVSRWKLTSYSPSGEEESTFVFPRRSSLDEDETVIIACQNGADMVDSQYVWDTEHISTSPGSKLILTDSHGESVCETTFIRASDEDREEIFHADAPSPGEKSTGWFPFSFF